MDRLVFKPYKNESSMSPSPSINKPLITFTGVKKTLKSWERKFLVTWLAFLSSREEKEKRKKKRQLLQSDQPGNALNCKCRLPSRTKINALQFNPVVE